MLVEEVLGFVENYYKYMSEEKKEISEELQDRLIAIVKNEAFWANCCLKKAGQPTLQDLNFNKIKKGILSESDRLEFLMLIGMDIYKIFSVKVLDYFDRSSSACSLCNLSKIDESVCFKWLPDAAERITIYRNSKNKQVNN